MGICLNFVVVLFVNPVIINNIRYADDTTLVAESMKDLQRRLQKVGEYGNKYGLKINKESTKTKFMAACRKNIYNNLTLKKCSAIMKLTCSSLCQMLRVVRRYGP